MRKKKPERIRFPASKEDGTRYEIRDGVAWFGIPMPSGWTSARHRLAYGVRWKKVLEDDLIGPDSEPELRVAVTVTNWDAAASILGRAMKTSGVGWIEWDNVVDTRAGFFRAMREWEKLDDDPLPLVPAEKSLWRSACLLAWSHDEAGALRKLRQLAALFEKRELGKNAKTASWQRPSGDSKSNGKKT